jgi:hypothetical protein
MQPSFSFSFWDSGELHDWWSDDTVANYEKRSTCIADLFSTYSIDDRHVNGKYTLGEDIADSGDIFWHNSLIILAYISCHLEQIAYVFHSRILLLVLILVISYPTILVYYILKVWETFCADSIIPEW